MIFKDKWNLCFFAIMTVILALTLSACSVIPTKPVVPTLPQDIQEECIIHHPKFNTNEDLIYGLYSMKQDLLECNDKHKVVVNLYNNIKGK